MTNFTTKVVNKRQVHKNKKNTVLHDAYKL